MALINDGYLPESGWVWFQADSNFVDISLVSQPDSVSGANTYGWQYDNLYPSTSLSFTFEATIPGPPLVTNVLYFDSDGDGFFSFEDCDDYNPSINPEAEEIPNNDIDEDCDGEDLISSVENKILESILLSPNPTPGVFHISNPTSKEITISAMDIHGRVILRSSGQNGDVNVDISHRENGLYFVSIRDENGGSKVRRIIKL